MSQFLNHQIQTFKTCWEIVSHSDWQTWRSCQTEKYFAGLKKKAPKKFTVMYIMFCLAFLECFTIVLAIGHLISPLVFIEVKVIQFLVFSVVQICTCICYVFYSVCLVWPQFILGLVSINSNASFLPSDSIFDDILIV